MYELKVAVTKVMGTCTADPPMKPGDYFTVCHGDIRIPDGGCVCLWALQSLLPVITPKEREILEEKDQDWMWRVHHAQCPDPAGRVIFQIEQTEKLDRLVKKEGTRALSESLLSPEPVGHVHDAGAGLKDLRVIVEEVKGKCTSGMRPGDHFILRSGRLTIPSDRHFCLYALHAALPMLPAKQRHLAKGDWMRDAHHVICPDPAGNVVMRIEPFP